MWKVCSVRLRGRPQIVCAMVGKISEPPGERSWRLHKELNDKRLLFAVFARRPSSWMIRGRSVSFHCKVWIVADDLNGPDEQYDYGLESSCLPSLALSRFVSLSPYTKRLPQSPSHSRWPPVTPTASTASIAPCISEPNNRTTQCSLWGVFPRRVCDHITKMQGDTNDTS